MLENVRLVVGRRSRERLLHAAPARHRARHPRSHDRRADARAGADSGAARRRHRVGPGRRAGRDAAAPPRGRRRRCCGSGATRSSTRIAVLVGQPAPAFTWPSRDLAATRRRSTRACPPTCSNAGPMSPRPSARWRRQTRRIGVARSAYFPSVDLARQRRLAERECSEDLRRPKSRLGGRRQRRRGRLHRRRAQGAGRLRAGRLRRGRRQLSRDGAARARGGRGRLVRPRRPERGRDDAGRGRGRRGARAGSSRTRATPAA